VWSLGHLVERARATLPTASSRVLGRATHPRSAPYGVFSSRWSSATNARSRRATGPSSTDGIGHLSRSPAARQHARALGAWSCSTSGSAGRVSVARLAAQKAAALAGVSIALAYCLLAGFGLPAQRTLYMIGPSRFAMWMRRATSSSRVLAIALFIVIAIDPWAVLDAGFWLSFTAVGAIFYATSGRLRWRTARGALARMRRALHDALRVQWAVTLRARPLTMLLFQQVSLVSPLANAIAIPVVSFVVTAARARRCAGARGSSARGCCGSRTPRGGTRRLARVAR